MITQPQIVISNYLKGLRKLIMNPFAFLAVDIALSLIIFNYYADDFIKINSSLNSEKMPETREKSNVKIPKGLSEKEIRKLKFEKKSTEFTLKFTDGML
jgi:regulatory protein YycI of two-component signal transduction system YycFG